MGVVFLGKTHLANELLGNLEDPGLNLSMHFMESVVYKSSFRGGPWSSWPWEADGLHEESNEGIWGADV